MAHATLHGIISLFNETQNSCTLKHCHHITGQDNAGQDTCLSNKPVYCSVCTYFCMFVAVSVRSHHNTTDMQHASTQPHTATHTQVTIPVMASLDMAAHTHTHTGTYIPVTASLDMAASQVCTHRHRHTGSYTCNVIVRHGGITGMYTQTQTHR